MSSFLIYHGRGIVGFFFIALDALSDTAIFILSCSWVDTLPPIFKANCLLFSVATSSSVLCHTVFFFLDFYLGKEEDISRLGG